MDWLRQQYKEGSAIYSACSGSVMLAETGLLDGREATSHWGYQDLFSKCYPKVRFRPEPNLVFADAAGRLVTAGGTTSWHDLAVHIISRYASPGEALRIAKVYLLKWHGEGQLPYATLVRNNPHADSVVRSCEQWLGKHYRETDTIKQVMVEANIPERTLKRRFKAATGSTLIDYIQNLRVEEAKHLLESGQKPVDEISVAVGYEDTSFFRRLFKRCTGLTPGQYRRMFQPVFQASDQSKTTVPS
jgi:transcriptional regulator GlxA family with amidase domain